MGIIRVSGIRIYAYHGCLDEEARIGGNYEVNVELRCNLEESANSDRLEDTVDYVAVNELVEREMSVRSKLIEHVARRIADAVRANFPNVTAVSVEVIKINPPINGNVRQVSVIYKA